ncbi:hypothetical protein LY90DRAFT_704290 [Neocallimastix californiae]|uniref:Uncharacterized protein n=1 Tax=Neocallimastix californiae TaxID=1754190 RepID=A0A1Y2BXD9_9FUNG|nr:hypothetical protein LY90DRAFT_704290 [Neocallimastix californiae]|eukprot:ORY39440.1 hypothetical protein LY90DRAFT_704290 [Neocallimastix californiae]
MDNLHEMFMAMHMSDNATSPLQIPSATSPFSNVSFPNTSPIENNSNTSSTENVNQQNTYQEAVNRPEDVQMGENGLTAYEEQMLFLEMQDQLYQQIEEERLRLQQM